MLLTPKDKYAIITEVKVSPKNERTLLLMDKKTKSPYGFSMPILLLFGLVGQLAWSLENMYFNLFVFEEIAPNLDVVTLMVQLSGITATVITLIAGTLSDKLGNRRSFISWGYAIWGVTVAVFGCLSTDTVASVLGVPTLEAISIALTLAVVFDCVMTLFGSTANDAAFNAWVTDNTTPSIRGRVEGILAILPLIAMLVVAGGFGIIKSIIGYQALFVALGAVISALGIFGIFKIKDAPTLERSGGFSDIFYGFRPSVIKENSKLYITLLVVVIYGIACQVFMPYIIIFMTTYLHFDVIEYSIVFGFAIILGAAVNLYLTRMSDKKDKARLMYVAAGIFTGGLLIMYLTSMITEKIALLVLFGIGGFVMITGNIFISALSGSLVRDYTPKGAVGKLQGVRMVFSVLIPMIVGPAVGNAVNKIRNVKLPDMNSADAMTTEYIPAPEIFLVGAAISLLLFAIIPVLSKKKK